jgi:hypothetical protein
MQEHRTSSAAGARTALRAPSSRSTARGLGISDALAVALVPEQLPACLDEIATVEQVLGEAVPSADEREIEERRHELALLRAMRHQLVGLEHEPALVGPAALVSQIVAGAAADSVALLEQALEIEGGRDRVIARCHPPAGRDRRLMDDELRRRPRGPVVRLRPRLTRGFSQRNRNRAQAGRQKVQNEPAPENRKPRRSGAFRGADEGTRTLDLLHGYWSAQPANRAI